MSKKMTKRPQNKPWKKHKQKIIPLSCGVRVEVDRNIAGLIVFLNNNKLETRHSCEGRKYMRAYVSMFATPVALGLAHYLLDNGGPTGLTIEREIHPYGYENLTVRWRKRNQKEFEALVHKYFS